MLRTECMLIEKWMQCNSSRFLVFIPERKVYTFLRLLALMLHKTDDTKRSINQITTEEATYNLHFN
jgi:hypothetical protein